MQCACNDDLIVDPCTKEKLSLCATMHGLSTHAVTSARQCNVSWTRVPLCQAFDENFLCVSFDPPHEQTLHDLGHKLLYAF